MNPAGNHTRKAARGERSTSSLSPCAWLLALLTWAACPPLDAAEPARLDFSHCGYAGGGVPIPDAPVRVTITPAEGDSTQRIQAALDYVAQLPADARGLRGAVLLLRGRHEVADSLRISATGVVLRGQGQGSEGTLLVATGKERRTLIQVAGKSDRTPTGVSVPVAERVILVGSRTLRVQAPHGFQVGQSIQIRHPSTAAWIAALGMDFATSKEATGWLRWLPGKMDVLIDRVLTAVDGDTLTLDAPLPMTLDAALARCEVQAYAWPGRLTEVGVENLRCESAFDRANPKDEEHAWMAVTLDAVENGWVRQLTAVHFVSSAVQVGDGCRGVTVEDCSCLKPVSELGGFRRHSFHTTGQLTLFQRCKAEQGRHDFAVGHLAAGPNAFVDCEAVDARSFSGPIGSWATGVLYDNVNLDGGGLALTNREVWDQGAGWAAANGLLWNCTAPVITCRKPPTAQNAAVGCWGQFVGDGAWESVNSFVKPDSLYRSQLAARHGKRATEQGKPRAIPCEPGNAPPVETVAAAVPQRTPAEAKKPVVLANGWLTCNGTLLTGSRGGTVWWRGSILPSRAAELGVGLTRFVPGRSGPGYTDDLEQLGEAMRAKGQTVLEHHWGLWYDRRRDDHQMIRRADGDVWPPFYEQPWARSGQGTAWDGLSKYDLTKFNPWYFGRLKAFADQCDRRGLVLLHQMYFQHNLLEAGAHWADFPWRPANCLQATDFPEPPPYVNRKRIFMAEAFYDVTHPTRRALHRAYIRKCLHTLGDNTNVIFCTGEEYTGPLAFVQFWLDTIAEWQRETGKKILVGLSCTKDVQDAILTDPLRGPRVAVIDLRYWWYTAKDSLYAPQGGQSLAPRQQLREWQGSKTRSSAGIARQVREYRDRYPDKAVLASFDRADGWAILAGGGSIPDLPATLDSQLATALPRMKPTGPSDPARRQWIISEKDRNYLVYAPFSGPLMVDLTEAEGTFAAYWIDLRTGTKLPAGNPVRGGRKVEFAASGAAAHLLWLTKP